MRPRTVRAGGPALTLRRAPLHAGLVLLTAAFLLNVIWEFAQAPLYDGRPPTWVFLRAAVTDAVLISLAALAAAVAARWAPAVFWPLLVGSLAATAVVIEARALAADRWSYAEAMPTVATVGLSPLVQLPLLGGLSVVLAWALGRRLGRRRAGAR